MGYVVFLSLSKMKKDKYFSLFRMFPSLVNCCTIDWFTEWPGDALEKVATKFLEDMDMDDEVKTNREKNQIHSIYYFLFIFFSDTSKFRQNVWPLS